MHIQQLDEWAHAHDFFVHPQENERRTRWVMGLTAVTMVAEIAAGAAFGSMALLADGWHMGTHVAAFVITLFAYRYARRNARNPDFTFGPGKVGVLGGFASAVALAVVALLMAAESAARFFAPVEIHYGQSLAVAVAGLAVNLASAWLLRDGHDHDHHHDHHDHHDHNLKAAYVHVLADALTSVLAIAALLLGRRYGWWALDPLMGIVGAVVITRWAWGLVRETSAILLDASVGGDVRDDVRRAIEADADNRVTDLHVWRIGPRQLAAHISLATHHPRPADAYRALLAPFGQLVHVTVEVRGCAGPSCLPV